MVEDSCVGVIDALAYRRSLLFPLGHASRDPAEEWEDFDGGCDATGLQELEEPVLDVMVMLDPVPREVFQSLARDRGESEAEGPVREALFKAATVVLGKKGETAQQLDAHCMADGREFSEALRAESPFARCVLAALELDVHEARVVGPFPLEDIVAGNGHLGAFSIVGAALLKRLSDMLGTVYYDQVSGTDFEADDGAILVGPSGESHKGFAPGQLMDVAQARYNWRARGVVGGAEGRDEKSEG